MWCSDLPGSRPLAWRRRSGGEPAAQWRDSALSAGYPRGSISELQATRCTVNSGTPRTMWRAALPPHSLQWAAWHAGNERPQWAAWHAGNTSTPEMAPQSNFACKAADSRQSHFWVYPLLRRTSLESLVCNQGSCSVDIAVEPDAGYEWRSTHHMYLDLKTLRLGRGICQILAHRRRERCSLTSRASLARRTSRVGSCRLPLGTAARSRSRCCWRIADLQAAQSQDSQPELHECRAARLPAVCQRIP